ncbi:MAG: radical SAM protein [Oligoflexia bacterium]|nr:radical SAM protein [Oligoflexia bacterium]MBF0365702.1 radical SAM protein [Oligoflexia bacterium]
MKILLLAMPDAANNFRRMLTVPNLGLCMIASLIPKEHEVKIVDLILVKGKIKRYLQEVFTTFTPDVLGVSSMSFQYESAKAVMHFVRSLLPSIKIVLGGYHASLCKDEIEIDPGAHPIDFIIRGEGEHSFSQLIATLASGKNDFSNIRGLSYRESGRAGSNSPFIHNDASDLISLEQHPRPRREVRMLQNHRFLGKKIDCIETSRGCTHLCSFCSISQMYGTSFRCYPLERILEDLQELKANAVQSVLIVDDNITLNVKRFKLLCQAIIEQQLNKMEYIVQCSVVGIAADEELAALMAKANFRIVFLGIESVSQKNLEFLKKGDIRKQQIQAIAYLRKYKIAIMGGLIIGNPDDTKEDIQEVFREAKKMRVDLAAVQCVTPYPKTKTREELLKQNLVTNIHDYSRYTGFICNVRTKHLTTQEICRIMNWENIKMFFHPRWFIGNNLIRGRDLGGVKVLLNNFEHFRAFIKNDLFRSRHNL